MTTNNTILNFSNNRMIETQGELIKMWMKKRSRRCSKNIGMRKQEKSDYVRFKLDVLNSLL